MAEGRRQGGIAFIRMDSEVQTLVRRADEVWAVTRAECERAREMIREIAFELPARIRVICDPSWSYRNEPSRRPA